MTKLNKTSTIAVLAVAGAVLAGGMAMAHGMSDRHDGARGAGRSGPPAFSFTELDANGDGQVTQEEFSAFKAGRVASVDADGDGFLTADELAAAAEARRAEARADRQSEHFQRLLDRADADDDGKLSVDEFTSFMDERAHGPKMTDGAFPRGWDANGDGVVTAEEFENARTAMAERFGEHRGEHRGDRDGRHGDW